MVLHSFAQTKVYEAVWGRKKGILREKLKPCLLSHLHTHDQSLQDCQIVFFLESYKNCRPHFPPVPTLDGREERGFQAVFANPISTSFEAY